MTLGLCAKRYVGAAVPRTTRIPVPLTLLDACLVRAIVLFLAAPLVDSSIFQPGAASDGRAAASGAVLSALLLSSAAALLSTRRAACSSLPAGIARILLEASSGRGTGSRQLYACGLDSARKTLAPRGESFVVALLREHTLLRTSRNELRPETVYILGSYAHARVTAGLLVILRRNAPSGVDRVARCAPGTTPPCQRRSDSGTPSPRQRRSDSRTPSPR